MAMLENLQSKVEIWYNTSAGTCWYKCFDLQGRETTKTVKGGRTFTLTTFERRINQEAASDPAVDLFRNGTFVLKRPSDDTDRAEIQTPDAITDEEIENIVREVMYGDLSIQDVIANISAPLTLNRILLQLVAEDAKSSIIKAVQAKYDALNPGKPVEHEIVTVPDKPKDE